MVRAFFNYLLMPIACLLLAGWSQAKAQEGAAVAEILSLTGSVEVFSNRGGSWSPATAGQYLYAGDAVRTGDPGLAVILTNDGSRISVNRNSRFVLKKVPDSAPWLKVTIQAVGKSIYQLLPWRSGKPAEVAIENDSRHVDIEIETQTVKAGIRGTSLVLKVLPESAGDTSIVSVLEGSVQVTALTVPDDSQIAESAQQIVAERGKPLVLRALTVSPADAVQWTLFVPDMVPRLQTAVVGADPKYATELSNSLALLQNGRLTEAKTRLLDLTGRHPERSDGYQMLAVVLLALNEKTLALDSATRAVDSDPESVSAAIVLSYVYQGMFDLDQARAETERALDLDPDSMLGLLNLARLQFGGDDVDGAWASLERAHRLAPANAEIYNLRGFIRLAKGEIDGAVEDFSRAIELDSRLGEPHLGLALAWMRQGETEQAFRAVAAAVALDPQRSVIRSYWGRMLYQVKEFDKALVALERARELDPNDPTPEFYRAIILRDLNRPQEAIQALNTAVELNDNRAVYRSRFLLDQDLAARNVDLSRLYTDVRLDTWALNRGLAAIKQDYSSSQAHLLYAGALSRREDQVFSFESEQLLARLLMPANVNSFNTYNNYTSLFEQPATEGTAGVGVGTQSYQSAEANVFGGAPRENLAYQAAVQYGYTDGWRDTNNERVRSVAALAKWEPTARDGVFVSASMSKVESRDYALQRFETDSPIRPDDRQDGELKRFELGYHRRLAPGSDFLVTLARLSLSPESFTRISTGLIGTPPAPGQPVFIDQDITLVEDRDFDQAQAQFMRRVGNHQFIAGTLQLWGEDEASAELEYSGETLVGGPDSRIPLCGRIPLSCVQFADSGDLRVESYYLQDIWSITPQLTLELAAYYDRVEDLSPLGQAPTTSGFDPRAGLIYTPDTRNTFRLAAFRAIQPILSARTDPTQIAGIPVFRNDLTGSEHDVVAASWEYGWDSGLAALSLSRRNITSDFTDRKLKGRRKSLEVDVNQLLKPNIGVYGRYRYLKVEDDRFPDSDRKEHLFQAGLRYVRPDGISIGAVQTFRNMDLTDRQDKETLAITDIEFAYELPEKAGELRLDVWNLFDQEFNWVTDPLTLQGREPGRVVTVRVSLNF